MPGWVQGGEHPVCTYIANRFAQYIQGLPTLRASGGDTGGGGEGLTVYPRIVGSLCANSHPGSYTGQDALNDMFPIIKKDEERNQDGMDSIDNGMFHDTDGGCGDYIGCEGLQRPANCHRGGPAMSDRKYVLRRLTPLECLRLMGLPDWWCDGVEGSDSAIYKMCGNGIAIPCAYDVLGRIVKAYEREGEAK